MLSTSVVDILCRTLICETCDFLMIDNIQDFVWIFTCATLSRFNALKAQVQDIRWNFNLKQLNKSHFSEWWQEIENVLSSYFGVFSVSNSVIVIDMLKCSEVKYKHTEGNLDSSNSWVWRDSKIRKWNEKIPISVQLSFFTLNELQKLEALSLIIATDFE